MHYTVILMDEVKAKLHALPQEVRRAIGHRLFLLEEDMQGDVKKLQGTVNNYRLRVGNYRVLFELEGRQMLVYAVGDRKEIYQ